MPKPITISGNIEPGVNVDEIDVQAGLAEAVTIGYSDAESRMTVDYCLSRWSKGEEDLAQQTALNGGIDLTSWYRILAAAQAGGAEHAKIYAELETVIKETMHPSPDEDYSEALHSLVRTIMTGRRTSAKDES